VAAFTLQGIVYGKLILTVLLKIHENGVGLGSLEV
jgi:hypothetical protein